MEDRKDMQTRPVQGAGRLSYPAYRGKEPYVFVSYARLDSKRVLAEIKRLNQSEYVRLARKAQRVKYSRRQYLYTLRALEKQGRALAENGVDDHILDYCLDAFRCAEATDDG